MCRRLDAILPRLLLASTIPHAVLVYHATPLEIARHGAVLSLVVLISAVWLIALAADEMRIERSAPA